MNAQHTPTPWTARNGGHNHMSTQPGREDMMDWCSGIDCEAPFKENDGSTVDDQRVANGYGRTIAEAQANAAFIVRACNSHEALVAALKLARIAINEEVMAGEHDHPIIRAHARVLDKVDAALAQAGEGA